MSIRTLRPTARRGQRPAAGTDTSVSGGIRRGLAWSGISSLVLRLGTFAVGIFLARMFTPEQFGLFAVVLTVQTVLMTLADFGLSTDLIRSADHRRKAPTVATFALVISAVLTAGMMAGAQPIADLLGAPGAGPVLAVMSLTLLIAGIGVVPFATLQRNFRQKQVFLIAVADFVVGTALIVVLVLAGWGVMALAVSRVVAQLVAVVLQFALAGDRPRFGLDWTIARGAVLFGAPVAGANLLSWALLGADKVLVSSLAGATALGFYFLAFNIANWPMSALGQVVRSVSLPAFSRVAAGARDRSLATALAPVWAVAVLAGLMIVLLAAPTIEVVYGARWLAAAPLLMLLGGFGVLRTVLDLATSYLLARGESGRVFWLQVAWMVLLVPALVVAILYGGGHGAAVTQLATGVVLLGVYARALARAGADMRAAWSSFWPPLAAAVPAAAATWLATLPVVQPLADLLVGGLVGTAVYAGLLWTWMRARLSAARRLGADDQIEAPSEDWTDTRSTPDRPASTPDRPAPTPHLEGTA